jgi:hypothetical protein
MHVRADTDNGYPILSSHRSLDLSVLGRSRIAVYDRHLLVHKHHDNSLVLPLAIFLERRSDKLESVTSIVRGTDANFLTG